MKTAFPILFRLCSNKQARISELGEWRAGEWVWKWSWRRELFDRKIDVLNKLIAVINWFQLRQEVKDEWRWRASLEKDYSTKKAYETLTQEAVLEREIQAHLE